MPQRPDHLPRYTEMTKVEVELMKGLLTQFPVAGILLAAVVLFMREMRAQATAANESTKARDVVFIAALDRNTEQMRANTSALMTLVSQRHAA